MALLTCRHYAQASHCPVEPGVRPRRELLTPIQRADPRTFFLLFVASNKRRFFSLLLLFLLLHRTPCDSGRRLLTRDSDYEYCLAA